MRTVLHRLYFGFTPCDVRRELLLARARLEFVDLSCLERVDLMCLHLFVFGMLCFFFLFFLLCLGQTCEMELDFGKKHQNGTTYKQGTIRRLDRQTLSRFVFIFSSHGASDMAG